MLCMTTPMDLETHNGCYMVYAGPNLYIINPALVDNDPDQAKAVVAKIIAKEDCVKTLSYNGCNYNYSVDGILVNCKPTEDKTPSRKKEYVIVRESPAMYQSLERRIRPKAPNWVKNIFSGKATGEIIFKQTKDYYLMPDFKWDHEPQHLYLLVLFTDLKLHSLRDVTDKHIPMLMRAQDEVLDYIYEQYGIGEDKLRIYFHYQPSAWQLHMHVQHLESPVVNSNQSSKAITLTDVIQNLRLKSSYYRDATLECIISTVDKRKYYS